MTKRILFILTLISAQFAAKAQQPGFTIKGNLLDATTKEQLIGATVSLTASHNNTITRLDGSFAFEHIQPGTYHLRCSYIGFMNIDTVLNVNGNMRFDLFMRSSSSALHEVVVNGERLNPESEATAKKLEQNASNVLNVLSAKAIQLSPDITIANALQRVSGISMERSSSGDGRYAIIRGMDKRYNNTLINGIKIPSPDSKNRFVPLDIFPADLVERVEVSKTLTPDMEPDAIGGTVNMVMKSAPEKLYVNASVSTGFSQTVLDRGFDAFPVDAINKKSPYRANGPAYRATPDDFTRDNLHYTHKSTPANSMATLSVGNRFLDNKLGVMLGGSYTNTYRSYSSIFNPDEFQEGGVLSIKHSNLREYSTQLTRMGYNAKLDYRLNTNNNISLDAVYADLKDIQARFTTDSLMPPPRTMPGTGQVWEYGRSKYQHQTIFNAALHGEHALLPGRLKLDWTASYSKATNEIPDWAEYEYDGGFYTDPATPNAAPYKHQDVVQNMDRTWWKNYDRDLTGYLNLAYTGKAFNAPYTLKAGGMYRDKHRDNQYDNYELRPEQENGAPQTWNGIYNFKWTVFNPTGSASDPNNYRADETIMAGYAMVTFQVRKLETILGVRVENTDQAFDTDIPVTQPAKSGSITYTDVLPGVNFKYRLNNRTNIRLAYYAAINRAGFFEIVPAPFDDDQWEVRGNTELRHSTAHNFDLRYELFPKLNEQLLVGAFYKSITDPIEFGFTNTGQQNARAYMPNNYGTATNFGFELVYEKYIGNFGIRANYTYTKSDMTSGKLSSVKDDATGSYTRVTIQEKRPLQGQADHIANAALLYKNGRLGLDAQIAWQYTGKRIVLVSNYYGFDNWQNPMSVFDIAAEKRIARHFSVFAKVQNLLNAQYEVYINKPVSNLVPVPFQDPSSGKTLAQRDQYGQNYQLGFRYILRK